MQNIEMFKEQMINLLELGEEDKCLMTGYLEQNSVDELFVNYSGLRLSEECCKQIESLKLIIEQYR
jgi:hypothetical protein